MLVVLAAAMPGRSAAAGITYAYDALGRLAAVINTSITSGTNAAAYNYDAVGNLTSSTAIGSRSHTVTDRPEI